MAFREITYGILLTIICINILQTNSEWLNNIDCASYVDIVPTDPDVFRYHPLYVNLNRCKGADYKGTASLMTCSPKESETVELDVLDTNEYMWTKIKLQNDTVCEFKCRLDPSSCTEYQQWNEDTCVCDCKYKQGDTPPTCPPGEVFDYTHCKCVEGCENNSTLPKCLINVVTKP